jgi:putative addiction module CopG family antidote
MSRNLEATDLPEDIARLAEAQVATGRFSTVEEVIRAGVEAIASLDRKRAEVLAALREGEQSGVFEGDAFESVRAELGLTSR